MRTSHLILAAAVSLFSFPAYAASLDGVWALKDAPICEDGGLTDNWPLRISGKTWDGYESHCTANRDKAGPISLSCGIDGLGSWTQNVSVAISGDTLTVTEDGTTTTYTRCPE